MPLWQALSDQRCSALAATALAFHTIQVQTGQGNEDTKKGAFHDPKFNSRASSSCLDVDQATSRATASHCKVRLHLCLSPTFIVVNKPHAVSERAPHPRPPRAPRPLPPQPPVAPRISPLPFPLQPPPQVALLPRPPQRRPEQHARTCIIITLLQQMLIMVIKACALTNWVRLTTTAWRPRCCLETSWLTQHYQQNSVSTRKA